MSESVHDRERLLELQALPLERKIQITQTRIIEWYEHYNGRVCVSFSGGKDSTVLLHIARRLYPDIPAVFSNTGLEYASIQKFVKSWDNIDIVTPAMRFDEVVSTYGYPLIGKEVAEAIYYARRIRSQNSQVERERAERQSAAERISTGSSHNRPKERGSSGLQTNWKRLELGGGGEPLHPDERREEQTDSSQRKDVRNRDSETYWKRTELIGRYPGERNRAGVAWQTKSQFNKEKWLPLCRDVPILISHYCCSKMKKSPMHRYQTKNGYKPILATLAEESRIRKQGWIRHGCNAFDSKNPMSQPMSFWTEQDVLSYLVRYSVPIASIYGEIVSIGDDGNIYPPVDCVGNVQCNLKCSGCQRTGCAFCAFGMHREKGKTRFQILAEVEPRKYEYAVGGGQWADNPYYDPVAPEYDGEWRNWNPKKIWVPSKEGLGMGKVFDMVNEIYGKNFYRYD